LRNDNFKQFPKTLIPDATTRAGILAKERIISYYFAQGTSF